MHNPVSREERREEEGVEKEGKMEIEGKEKGEEREERREEGGEEMEEREEEGEEREGKKGSTRTNPSGSSLVAYCLVFCDGRLYLMFR